MMMMIFTFTWDFTGFLNNYSICWRRIAFRFFFIICHALPDAVGCIHLHDFYPIHVYKEWHNINLDLLKN
jgi:hypothetical protein